MGQPPMSYAAAVESMARRLAKRSKVRPDGCVEWTGYVNPNGYGQITLPSALRNIPALGRITTAPRAACWLAHGDRPADAYVLHSCDNRWCINPEHLRWGDAYENAQDAIERNRLRVGADHPDARLSDDDVIEIVRRARDGERVYALADEYGIDWSMIYAWLRGEGRIRHVAA